MVSEITERDNCTGCYACYNICPVSAINMDYDEYGFIHPVIDTELCIGCKQCQKVCPAHIISIKKEKPIQVYSGWSRDEKTRLNSASGGAFAEIAKVAFAMGAVVFGVAMDGILEAKHIELTNENELIKVQGSKYIQSNVGYSYKGVKNYLEKGYSVLFSGTPCQIAGLKSFLGKDYSSLYTVDLVCHGVPSVKLYNDYIRFLEQKIGKKIYDVKFRSKKVSWIYFNMAVNSHYEKEGKVAYDYEGGYYSDPYLRGFLRNNALRPSCYQCRFACANRVSDITIGDWWGYKHKDKRDKGFEKGGVSLILCNTKKGDDIIKRAQMELKIRTLDEAIKTNQALRHPYSAPSTKNEFWTDYSRKTFKEMLVKWMSPEMLAPSEYLRSTMANSFIKSFLVYFFRIIEGMARRMGMKKIRIKAKMTP